MSDLKEILLILFKAPNLIPLVITLIVTNQKWLFPQIPEQVVNAFLDVLTLVLLSITAYYVGATRQKDKYKRAAVNALPQLSRPMELVE